MSLFNLLMLAGVQADLTKNEYKVYMVLLMQTIGYGKDHDNMTDRRLQQLTGIRMDRMRTALANLIEKGLFDGVESTEYGYCYSIPDEYLNNDPDFYTPHIPKNRRIPRKEEDYSENQKDIPKVGQHNKLNPTDLTSQTLPQQPPCDTVADKIKKGGKSEGDENEEFKLPSNILPADQQACQIELSKLTPAQRTTVLKIFAAKQQAGQIRSPAGLLITLAKRAREGTLITIATPPQSAGHPSFKPFEANDDEQERKVAQLQWIYENARREKLKPEAFAEQMGMGNILAEVA